jgi:enoyl-CoA hydratase/carnithine racemase
LEVSRGGRVLRLKLNRPKKRNALNYELCLSLAEAIEGADADPSVGAILITAEGPAFSAGMDLDEILTPRDSAIAAIHERLFTIGTRVSKPIVAGIAGPALAGGMGLAANAHVVVATEASTFGLTEIRIGLWPFLIFRAVSLAIGERRAVELSITGRVFGAAEALAMGLVHEIAPAGRADEIAAGIAERNPDAFRTGLQFVNEIRGRNWKEAGEASIRHRAELFQSAGFQESVAAFREKRKKPATTSSPENRSTADPGSGTSSGA